MRGDNGRDHRDRPPRDADIEQHAHQRDAHAMENRDRDAERRPDEDLIGREEPNRRPDRPDRGHRYSSGSRRAPGSRTAPWSAAPRLTRWQDREAPSSRAPRGAASLYCGFAKRAKSVLNLHKPPNAQTEVYRYASNRRQFLAQGRLESPQDVSRDRRSRWREPRRPGAPAQPALSLALKRLETELGSRLPPARAGSMTDEGMLVAETCRSLNALVRNAETARQSHRGGPGAHFHRGHFEPRLRALRCRDRQISRPASQGGDPDRHHDLGLVAPALLRDEIDICVAPAQVLRSDLKYDFLFDEVHKAYCGRGHPLYGKTSIAPRRSRASFVLTGADEPDSLTAYRTRHGLGVHVAGLRASRRGKAADEPRHRHLLPARGLRRARRRRRTALAAPCGGRAAVNAHLRHHQPRAPNKLARALLAEIGVPAAAN